MPIATRSSGFPSPCPSRSEHDLPRTHPHPNRNFRRVWRLLRWVVYLTLASLIIACAFAYWLVATEGGAQFAFGKVQELIGKATKIEGVEGSIGSVLRIGVFEIVRPELVVRIEDLEADISPSYTGRIIVHRLHANSVEIRTAPIAASRPRRPERAAAVRATVRRAPRRYRRRHAHVRRYRFEGQRPRVQGRCGERRGRGGGFDGRSPRQRREHRGATSRFRERSRATSPSAWMPPRLSKAPCKTRRSMRMAQRRERLQVHRGEGRGSAFRCAGQREHAGATLRGRAVGIHRGGSKWRGSLAIRGVHALDAARRPGKAGTQGCGACRPRRIFRTPSLGTCGTATLAIRRLVSTTTLYSVSPPRGTGFLEARSSVARREACAGNVHVGGGAAQADLQLADVDLATLHGKLRKTQLNGKLSITGDENAQRFEATLEDPRFALEAKASLASHRIEVQSARVRAGGGTAQRRALRSASRGKRDFHAPRARRATSILPHSRRRRRATSTSPSRPRGRGVMRWRSRRRSTSSRAATRASLPPAMCASQATPTGSRRPDIDVVLADTRLTAKGSLGRNGDCRWRPGIARSGSCEGVEALRQAGGGQPGCQGETRRNVRRLRGQRRHQRHGGSPARGIFA